MRDCSGISVWNVLHLKCKAGWEKKVVCMCATILGILASGKICHSQLMAVIRFRVTKILIRTKTWWTWLCYDIWHRFHHEGADWPAALTIRSRILQGSLAQGEFKWVHCNRSCWHKRKPWQQGPALSRALCWNVAQEALYLTVSMGCGPKKVKLCPRECRIPAVLVEDWFQKEWVGTWRRSASFSTYLQRSE